jgi:hypothetical protein
MQIRTGNGELYCSRERYARSGWHSGFEGVIAVFGLIIAAGTLALRKRR